MANSDGVVVMRYIRTMLGRRVRVMCRTSRRSMAILLERRARWAGRVQALLRSRYYQRAFRAITTGHSNRRRTQIPDFEDLEIAFPASAAGQRQLIAGIDAARSQRQNAAVALSASLLRFTDLIDGRGDEEFPELDQDAGDEI